MPKKYKEFTWDKLSFWQSKEWKNIQDVLSKEDFCPHRNRIFRALYLTPFKDVRVSILGGEPDVRKGFSDGLCFSCDTIVEREPMYVRNIRQLYMLDTGFPKPRTRSLATWANRGVLLLNVPLTVGMNRPRSHYDKMYSKKIRWSKDIGWGRLIIEILGRLKNEKENNAFCFWGDNAMHYAPFMDEYDRERHLVLENTRGIPHQKMEPRLDKPYYQLIESKPFTTINQYFNKHNKPTIDWKLP